MDDITFFILAGIAAFCVGLAKGGVANAASISVPLLALVISPITAAALLLPIFVVADFAALWFYRRSYSLPNLYLLVPSAIVGVVFGWTFAAYISDVMAGIAVGLIGIWFCLREWLKHKDDVEPAPTNVVKGMFWGWVAGLASFISHSGSPPVQAYLLPQRLDKLIFAGTMTYFFIIINMVKIVPYYFLDQFDGRFLNVTLYLLPVGLLGTFLGVKMVRKMPEKIFYSIIYVLLFLVSVQLIFKGCKQLLMS